MKEQCWAAHIWCWPTPVMIIALLSVTSESFFRMNWGSSFLVLPYLQRRVVQPHLFDVLDPVGVVRRFHLGHHRLKDSLEVPYDGNGGLDVLAYLRRVNVYVYDLGVGSECAQPAGYPVVEAGP